MSEVLRAGAPPECDAGDAEVPYALTAACLDRRVIDTTVITTISTAIAVHVAAGRYDFQLIEFLRTAER